MGGERVSRSGTRVVIEGSGRVRLRASPMRCCEGST